MLRIKELREKQKITQKELGKIMGVTGQTILNWENGIHTPNEAQLNKLADLFGVTLDYLFNRTNEHDYEGLIDNLKRLSKEEYIEALARILKDSAK